MKIVKIKDNRGTVSNLEIDNYSAELNFTESAMSGVMTRLAAAKNKSLHYVYNVMHSEDSEF